MRCLHSNHHIHPLKSEIISFLKVIYLVFELFLLEAFGYSPHCGQMYDLRVRDWKVKYWSQKTDDVAFRPLSPQRTMLINAEWLRSAYYVFESFESWICCPMQRAVREVTHMPPSGHATAHDAMDFFSQSKTRPTDARAGLRVRERTHRYTRVRTKWNYCWIRVLLDFNKDSSQFGYEVKISRCN